MWPLKLSLVLVVPLCISTPFPYGPLTPVSFLLSVTVYSISSILGDLPLFPLVAYMIPNICGYMDYNSHTKGLKVNIREYIQCLPFGSLDYFTQEDFFSYLHPHFII